MDLAAAAACVGVAALRRGMMGFTAGSGLGQYDEGIYAFSAAGVAGAYGCEGLHPHQALHAPALFPWLGGVAARLFDADPGDALRAVATVAGYGVVAAMYAAARVFACPTGASAAALLVAVSPLHAVFSRAALTDTPFTCAFLLAVAALGAAFRRPTPVRAATGGVAVALAWNLKYHGWAAWAAFAVAAVLDARRDPLRRAPLLRAVAVSAAVAAAGFLPWAITVDVSGPGLDAVLKKLSEFVNPRFYVEHAGVQASALTLMDGSAAVAATLVLVAAGLVCAARERRREALVAVVAAAALCASLPCYRPYIRLLPPVHACVALLAAPFASAVARRVDRAIPELPLDGAAAGIFVVAAAGISVLGASANAPSVFLTPDNSGAVLAVNGIAAGRPIVVLGEPGIAYALRRLGVRAVDADHPADVERLFAPGAEVAVISGLYVRRTGEMEVWTRLRAAAAREVAAAESSTAIPWRPGAVRILDDVTPDRFREASRTAERDYALDVRLVRLR